MFCITAEIYKVSPVHGTSTHNLNTAEPVKPGQRYAGIIRNSFASGDDRLWTRIGVLLMDRFDTGQHIVRQIDIDTGDIAA